jgi:hypothetical protein
MFHLTLTVEVSAHAHALDLAGLKHTIELIEPLAAQYPGWRGCLLDAQARFQRLSGDLTQARGLFEQAIAACPVDAQDRSPIRAIWISARSGLAEILLAQDRAEESKRVAAETLALCERQAIGAASVDVVRQLALAEARLGEHATAAERIEQLIASQLALGVSGLRLGMSYETRARVAMAAGDQAGFDENARAAAREYRYAQRSPLGVRYERLITEASRSGFHSLPEMSQLDAQRQDGAPFQSVSTMYSVVMSAMLTARDTDERARNALRITCISRGAREGHLYLVRGQEIALSASQGGSGAPDDLRLLVGDYIARERERSETMTVVATGDLEGAAELQSNVRIGSASYDLMLLSCVIGNTGHLVGVVAIATADSRPRVQQSQLLASLAAHFVQAGDCGPAVA